MPRKPKEPAPEATEEPAEEAEDPKATAPNQSAMAGRVDPEAAKAHEDD